MPIVSYAQNFEDVMLWRALKHIENGFYVDVGANDPVTDSVTNLFYINGWTGINIEPLRSHYSSLIEGRPKDINVNCAISDTEAELEIWESEVRGWATLDKNIAEQHELNGFKGLWTKTPVKTLKNVLEQYLPDEVTDFHFLKIDVEGLEANVVKSNDWIKFRPWIVIIESTIPNSQTESFEDWERVLLDNNYIFSYFDGLNRFYISKEHEELSCVFLTPPNVFDEFIKHSEVLKENKIESLEYEKESIEKSLADKKQAHGVLKEENEKVLNENDHLKNEISSLNVEIDEVHNSRSWKLTAPLRKISSFFKRK